VRGTTTLIADQVISSGITWSEAPGRPERVFPPPAGRSRAAEGSIASYGLLRAKDNRADSGRLACQSLPALTMIAAIKLN